MGSVIANNRKGNNMPRNRTKTKVLTNMVFVYGTLKRGCGNHCVMEEAGGQFVTEATTSQLYPMEVHGLPFLYESPGEGHHVRGEVFCITKPDGLKRLDRLEGHPGLYERKPIGLTDGAGNTFFAWTYFFQGSRHGTELVDEYMDGRSGGRAKL